MRARDRQGFERDNLVGLHNFQFNGTGQLMFQFNIDHVQNHKHMMVILLLHVIHIPVHGSVLCP